MSASYTRILIHLVWSTWNREAFFDDRGARRIAGRLAAVARSLHCPPLAVGCVSDHVHLLVVLHPSVAIAELVRVLKVGTTSFARSTLKLERFAWQMGYGAFSLCEAEREVVTRYVENQQAHHDTNDLIEPWEQAEFNPAKAG